MPTLTDCHAAFVYLLRCSDDTLYCGWTTDVERRVREHGAGTASRYTRSRLPVALAWSQALPDRSAARREEARIKGLTRARKLALIAG
jgi:putative endonuclease